MRSKTISLRDSATLRKLFRTLRQEPEASRRIFRQIANNTKSQQEILRALAKDLAAGRKLISELAKNPQVLRIILRIVPVFTMTIRVLGQLLWAGPGLV
jgi:hypothetical protein